MQTIKIASLSFSQKELKDLLKAWLAISFAFANLLTSSLDGVITAFIISALTVGVGFIFHELGHKFLAQKYGAWAEFRSWDQMLIFAIFLSFLGFIIAAPGAVMISGRTIGRKRNGKISAMGPGMSLGIAILFLFALILFPSGILNTIGRYGFVINTWLGLFNLIPIANLDGKKILEWNKIAYAGLVILALSLMGLQTAI